MRFKGTLNLLTIILMLSSCGNYSEQKGAEEKNVNLSSEPIDFSLVQEKIFSSHCVSCHQQYASYAGVRRELDSISAAINANRMPKAGGPLTDGLKQLLQSWIADGAPEVVGQTPKTDPESLQPTWKSMYDNIISPRCLVCHNSGGQAKFLDLSTRQAIFSRRNEIFGPDEGMKLVDFDFPEQSYLIEIVKDEVEPMPPTWSNIRRLNNNEIQIFIEWIRLGLP